MLFGQHNCLMDEKGRLAFPVDLRAGLNLDGHGDELGRFMLTQSLFDASLQGMTRATFDQLVARARALPPSERGTQLFMRKILGSAKEVSVDRAGRVAVPRELREYAGLERDAVWVGLDAKVELWSRARFDAASTTLPEEPATTTHLREFLTRHGL
jgi:MraZ protein